MWTNVILVVFGLMVLSASFFIGFFVGVGSAIDMIEADSQREEDLLYCFECETEMPVKEVDGVLSCENCGLVHTNDYC